MINLALVGVRGFGSRHLKEIGQLEAANRIRLVAVVDPFFSDGFRTEDVSRFSSRGVAVYPSLDAILNGRKDFDAMALATPIHLHAAMLKQLLPTDKFLYVEKPPVPTMGELDELLGSDPCSNLAVAFQLIASPCVRRLKALLLEGELGEVRSIRASGGWPRDCAYYNRNRWAGRLRTDVGNWVFDGPATNAFAHLVHLTSFLAGESKDAFAIPEFANGLFLRARPEIEAPDSVLLCGIFPQGPEYRIAVTHCSRSEQAMEVRVVGSRGTASLHADASLLTLNDVTICESGGHDQAITLAYENFVSFAEGRLTRPATRLADCRGYLEATWGAFQPAQSVERIDASLVSEIPSTAGGRQYVVQGMDEVLHETLNSEGGSEAAWLEEARQRFCGIGKAGVASLS